MTSIDGLVSGLNTTQIISQLMAVERLPEQQITTKKTASQTLVSTLQQLNTLVTAMQSGAKALIPDSITGQSTWTTATATSTNSTLASATTGPGALTGSSTFTVTSVARAGAAVSSGTVGSLTSAVAGGPFVLTKGAPAIGLSAVDAGATLSAGSHTVAVTQSSAGATLTGSAPVSGFDAVPPAVTIDGSNNTIVYYLDGSSVPTSITLQSGTYTPVQLAAAIGRASGGTLTAAADAAGQLSLTTTHEGSAASLQLSGTGTANATLGLTDTSTVAQGSDGIIALDDGTAVTVSSVSAGDTLTLTAANGDSVTAKVAGGLRAGSATATTIGVAAGGTLADVISALNSSGAGVSATAVQVSSSAYRLQVSSSTTGADSDITLSQGAFPTATSGLGDMQELSAGSDTVLHVGTGAGAFDVTSSSTTVTGLMPGVTIKALTADPSTPVTVNVVADDGGMADAMSSLVDQANAVLSYLSSKSGYDTTTNTGGPLLGDSLARDLTQRVSDAAIGTSTSAPSLDGVTVTRDGTLSFDRAAFLAAYAADPSGVADTLSAMAQRLSDVAKAASDPIDGYVTARIGEEQDSIRDYTQQIADFEDRMTLRQQTLQQQYTNLETMLGTLKSQSDWLTGQLASLPTYSTSSK